MARRTYTDREARALTAMAIAEGLIRTDEPCCVCGEEQRIPPGGRRHTVSRHHPDITHRPLWTVPLCRPCHNDVHLSNIPDPGLGVLRSRIGTPGYRPPIRVTAEA